MLLSAIPVQSALAATPYTEKLSVYVSGADALWYFTFGGINGSSKLSAFESTPGLSWYNVTAIQTSSMPSDFQQFGPGGYNLLPAPSLPSQGMFLTLGSDSFSDASAAASALDSYLLTSFVSMSNGTGTYAFYSPVDFGTLIPATLYNFVPASEGGFAGALSSSTFKSSAVPFIVLEGRASSPGFSHSLVIGSITASALTSTDQPNLLVYFGTTLTSLQASNKSSSSVVQLRFLDGVVRSNDKATITSNNAQFTSSYTLSISHGKKLTKVNATVVEQPAPLLATRSVDVGVLRTNDILAVTLTLRDLSAAEPISKVSFSDNWWDKTGVFTVLKGSNYTAPSTGIAAGGSITPVYRLQYTGTAVGSFTIPASVVRYTYIVGSQNFNATAVLNPIRLSLGQDDAVLVATVAPSGTVGTAVGNQQKLDITVTNVGTLPASSVFIAGQSIAGLAAKSGASSGGTATVTVTKSALGLLGVNETGSYSTTYQDPAGNSLNATTNVIPVVFSHSAMQLPYPALTITALLRTLNNQETNVTLSIATSNTGPVNATSFKATATLPASLGCGKVNPKSLGGKGITCSGNTLSIAYPVLNRSSTLLGYMEYNLTTPLNYFISPISFTAQSAVGTFVGQSDAVAIPSGVVLSKTFSPSQLFSGMGSTVTVSATNSGPLQIYNATVATSLDSFDTLAGQSSLQKGPASIASGGNSTFSYAITTSDVSGNLTANAAEASFYFGGTSYTITGARPKVQIYQPLGVSIATHPTTPEEGKTFTITVTITNPSGVSVSNVLFTLPVPSGLGLSNLQNAQVSAGLLTVTASTLGGHSSATATASAVAGSGITVPFDNAKLTFNYAGHTINGAVPKTGIAIAEDVTTRYLIPTAIVIIALLAVAFYVRRMAAPSVPASPK
jgi:uncharacterized repeat protein (TIGR01451 family)